MKNLVLVFYPELKSSTISLRFAETIDLQPRTTVRHLYDIYDENKLSVLKEQSLLAQADRIILQFPFRNQTVPYLLEEWKSKVLYIEEDAMDNVTSLVGKEFILVVTSDLDLQLDCDLKQEFDEFNEYVEQRGAKFLQPIVLKSEESAIQKVITEAIDICALHTI